jgi:hypothetical protein
MPVPLGEGDRDGRLPPETPSGELKDIDTGEPLKSRTMIVTAANDFLRGSRPVPVILALRTSILGLLVCNLSARLPLSPEC